MINHKIGIRSTSAAADLGFKGLADLAEVAKDEEYRVVGGHMVYLLLFAYPTPRAIQRTTADTDAAIDRVVAASPKLHESLLAKGYIPTSGNRYELAMSEDDAVIIDLLVQARGGGNRMKPENLGGRQIDAVPGLNLAMNSDALWIEAHVQLNDGGQISFTVPVPDVESALVIKAAAWQSRGTDKDLHDVLTLLEIAHQHRKELTLWGLGDAALAMGGSRRDAAECLYRLVRDIESRRVGSAATQIDTLRLAALIRALVVEPKRPL